MIIKDKILIVEDEISIVRFLRTVLQNGGYEVIEAETGAEANFMIASHCPDLILLDLGLPDMDGIKVIEEIRRWTQVPVIVVSARDHDGDKVTALDKGADDYITKPFSTKELQARIRVALRHGRRGLSGGKLTPEGKLVIGDLTIDYDKHQVLVGGANAGLTHNEYRIVTLLGKFAGKVLTYDFIMKELWGPQSGGNNQILRVNMANIRRKIEKNPAEPEYIFTEVGVGYRMRGQEPE